MFVESRICVLEEDYLFFLVVVPLEQIFKNIILKKSRARSRFFEIVCLVLRTILSISVVLLAHRSCQNVIRASVVSLFGREVISTTMHFKMYSLSCLVDKNNNTQYL